MAEDEKIPFTIEEPEFDETTYVGRFQAYRKTSNVFNAFHSNKAITEMQKLVQAQKDREDEAEKKTGYREVKLTRKEIQEIRTAQTVVSTAIHPDTGKFIPWFMRLSSFVPINLPIAFGMVMTPPTPFNTILFQWLNQTYNAILNYGNRNATSLYTTQDVAKSYAVACSASIVVALGIRKALEKQTRHMRGAKLVIFNSFSAFWACSSAGFINALLMRQTELQKGVDVYDPKNPNVIIGKSKVAAQRAVFETAISRFALCITLLVPSFLLYGIEKMRLLPKHIVPLTTLQMSLFFLELYFAVPVGIALYPQFGTVKAVDIEPHIRDWKDENGKQVQEFMYNKGL